MPVHRNRSRETNATLFDAHNNAIFSFRVRAHGVEPAGALPWPDYSSASFGRNQFSPDGNTPTGLILFDLNSPEPNATLYGPYPVNRAVQGLQGNAKFLIPAVRDGILLHTGNWPGWTPAHSFPNSEGCIHTAPTTVHRVWQTLAGMGVQVRDNPFGKLPYPYKPQGLLSIELVDA